MRSRVAAAIAGILAGYVGPDQPLVYAAPNLPVKAPELEKKKYQSSITATYKTETEQQRLARIVKQQLDVQQAQSLSPASALKRAPKGWVDDSESALKLNLASGGSVVTVFNPEKDYFIRGNRSACYK